MSTRVDGHLLALDRLTAAEAGRAGAKASNCARLKQAGFVVPDGLVLLSTAPDRDLASITDHPWFDTVPDHERFAVRSSGIGEDGDGESFAGIHQTLLDVPRGELAAAVAACRASGRSATALEYRRAKGIAVDAIQMGVLIQRMVQPIAAGVAFTINPVTGARHEIVINASWGLGEALVSGQVDPDEFVVRKDTHELLWSRIGEKDLLDGAAAARATDSEVLNVPALTHEQVRELAAILTRIEREYGGAPQDIEWCHDGMSFWIVQSRPVTTGRAPTRETEWTRANLAEVLPDLTSPQVLHAFEDLLNEGERRFAGRLMAPEDQLGPIVKAFCGRLCFNLSQLRYLCKVAGIAPGGLLRSMGHADRIDPADDIAPRPSLDQLRHLPALLRMVSQHLRAKAIVRRHGTRTHAYLAELASHGDPQRRSDADVWAVIDDWIARAGVHAGRAAARQRLVPRAAAASDLRARRHLVRTARLPAARDR